MLGAQPSAGVFGLVLVGGVLWRWRAVRQAAPGTRGPLSWVPLTVRGPLSLAIGRRLPLGGGKVPKNVNIREMTLGGVRVFVYEPAGREPATGAIFWIHGGGFILGQADFDHDLCSWFADELGVVVVSVEYRLAPEHPFPAGLQDCYAALKGMYNAAAELSISPDRIVVAGGSAGGGLAASLTQLAVDRGEVPVAFQALLYPMLDDRTGAEPAAKRRTHLTWTTTSNRYAWSCYLSGPKDSSMKAYAVPGRREDLSGLPPAWIGVGDIDLFYNEDLDYSRRLQDSGVSTEFFSAHRMFHSAERICLDRSDVTREFRARLLAALRHAVWSAERQS